MDGLAHNEDGTGGLHLYMPWWLDDKKLDFPRGYHIEFWGGRGQPEHGIMGGVHKWNGGGYGKGLKEDYRRFYGATIGFAGRGEMIPNPDSYCEIDPDAVDKWGIPVLRFHFKWSDYERKQVAPHAGDVPRPDRHAGRHGPQADAGRRRGWGISKGGEIIHEVGTTRMGDSPKTSVLNRNCQAHEVPNLFVADAGPFVSNAEQEPDLDDPRAVDADQRVHRRGAAQGKPLGRRAWRSWPAQRSTTSASSAPAPAGAWPPRCWPTRAPTS